jgi:tRNA(Ile)-lysidine synthase
MANLEQHIRQFLGNDPTKHYFVACSGGVDSMVLVHILHKLGVRVSVLHVNYMLRGDDSERDQDMVERVCQQKGITAHVKRVDFNKYLVSSGGNLQEEARKVRYKYFENFKLKDSIRIVLAQHADDQVETFFLNLSRNAGIMGLACMLPEHNGYLRPLLPFTKDEVRNYAIENEVLWREDVSNASNKYNRNKLRNVLLPQLEQTIPTLKESVLTLVKAFQYTQNELEIKLKPIAESILLSQQLSFDQFDALDEFELIELLRQLNLPVSLHSEFAKLRNAEKGKVVPIPHKLFRAIIREDAYFYFQKEEGFTILPKLHIEKVNELPEVFTKQELFVDPLKIKGEVAVRRWKEGDRMKPLGMKGSKLISDILSDAKIPHHARHLQLVVHDEEKILWCVGLTVSREATSKLTKDNLQLKIQLI